jgi:hypothetical protein
MLDLDRVAAAQFPGLAGDLELSDLRRAGWSVEGPTAASDGSTRVVVTHPFHNLAQASTLMKAVTGGGNALRLVVARHRTFFSTKTAVAGSADLRGGADTFADAVLRRQLGVPSLSDALATLAKEGEPPPDLHVDVVAHLPGSVGHANATKVSGGTAMWSLVLGQDTTLTARASALNWPNLGLAAICIVCVLGLLTLIVRRLLVGGRTDGSHWFDPAPRRPRWRGRRGSWRSLERSATGRAPRRRRRPRRVFR